MSLETWKAEFYPTTAKQSARKGALAAAKHSLQKWIGATEGNLEKHGCGRGIFSAGSIAGLDGEGWYGEDRFYFDSETCALCVRFFRGDRPDPCATCPLAIVRDGVPCVELRNKEVRAPYHLYARGGSPEPMIRWLKKTVAYLEEGKGKR